MTFSYGKLNQAQEEALRPFVEGRMVHDLGAGELALSKRLVELGASHVVAVDKPGTYELHPTPPSVTRVQSYYSSFEDPIDIAFMSWPSNYILPCLRKLAERSRLVLYLGKNTDGTSCGTPGLFQHFMQREVLAYVPDQTNTLIVYGDLLPMSRVPRGEEKAAFSQSQVMSYEEAEGLIEAMPKRLRVCS